MATTNSSSTCGCPYLHSDSSNVLNWPAFPARLSGTDGYGFQIQSNTVLTFYTQDMTNRGLLGNLVLELRCPGECRPTCNTHASATNCNNKAYTGGECVWDSVNDVCRPACHMYSSQGACANATHCAWLSNTSASSKCQLRCNRRGYDGSDQCTADAECYWNTGKKDCRMNCNVLMENSTCSASSEDEQCFYFNDNKCRLACSLRGSTKPDRVGVGPPDGSSVPPARSPATPTSAVRISR